MGLNDVSIISTCFGVILNIELKCIQNTLCEVKTERKIILTNFCQLISVYFSVFFPFFPFFPIPIPFSFSSSLPQTEKLGQLPK